MWLSAFPPQGGPTAISVFSTAFVLAAMITSMVAFAKGTGAQYELKGRRLGLIVAMVGIISYLAGTSLQSGIIHTFSIAAFYSGCVLYLAGRRAFVSTLPASFMILSTFTPTAYTQWGLIYVDWLAWAVIVASGVLQWESRKTPQMAACYLCPSYESRGWSFCGSCGRKIASVMGPSSRRLAGLALFAVLMAFAFVPTVPLITTAPVSAVDYGLGGPRLGDHFAPLPGWSAKISTLSEGGVQVGEYTLSSAGTTIDAFVASSQNTTVFNGTRTSPVSPFAVRSPVNESMVGYSFQQKGTKYVDFEGVFQVTMLNGSSVQIGLVAIDLRQTAAGFASDHGSSLYAAAESVISWTSSSNFWSGWAENLFSAYQALYQAAVACSFASFGVALFTLARDDELAKSRRLESMHALEDPEKAVLEAFGPDSTPMTGAELRERNLKGNYWVPEPAIYSSLEELERRGLVSASVTLKKWAPLLRWRRLV
jgi:hypothetical protein